MSAEPQNLVNFVKLAEDIKAIKESLAKQEPGAKGFTESKDASAQKTGEVKSIINKSFLEYVKRDVVGEVFDPRALPKLQEAIGAQSSGSAIPQIWSAEPEMLSPEGADGFFLTNTAVVWKEDVKGKPGNTVYVQTIAPVTAASIVSGTEGTFTASTLTSVPVTLSQLSHGFYISKADLEDVVDGTLDKLVEASKMGVMRKVDDYFLSALQASAGNAAAGTINEAGAMASTSLAKMWGSLMAGSYKPGVLVLHPVQYASLLRDQQFVYAYAFGTPDPAQSGKIRNYLGMDIVPLVQGTLVASGGTYRAFMMAKGAFAGAIKRELSVEKEYYVKDQRNYVVTMLRMGGTVVHTSGIGLITSVNG
jgi:hypothetical protein